jgi:hypothetical protein
MQTVTEELRAIVIEYQNVHLTMQESVRTGSWRAMWRRDRPEAACPEPRSAAGVGRSPARLIY